MDAFKDKHESLTIRIIEHCNVGLLFKIHSDKSIRSSGNPPGLFICPCFDYQEVRPGGIDRASAASPSAIPQIQPLARSFYYAFKAHARKGKLMPYKSKRPCSDCTPSIHIPTAVEEVPAFLRRFWNSTPAILWFSPRQQVRMQLK